MPLYEYDCIEHGRFEEIHHIEDRHNAVCPVCGGSAQLRISTWGRVIFAGWDTVIGHDGRILSRKQSTEQIPMQPERVHGSRY